MAASPHHRMTLELKPEHKALITSLKERSEAASEVEVIRRALRVYETLSDAVANGSEIVAVSADGRDRTVILPEFHHLRPKPNLARG